MSKLFQEVVTNYFEKLDLFTKAMTRAHGEHHPEVFEVRELFEAINKKVQEAGQNKPDLAAEFAQLRTITNHYAVPEGVCETYENAYKMLSEADEAYQA